MIAGKDFTIESTTDYKPFQEIDAFFARVHIALQYFLPGTVAEEFHVRFLTLRSKTAAEYGEYLMCISPIIGIKNYPSYKRGEPDCLPLWCGARLRSIRTETLRLQSCARWSVTWWNYLALTQTG